MFCLYEEPSIVEPIFIISAYKNCLIYNCNVRFIPE